ncbi:cleavage stimulation factor subunit 2-like [Mytilus californianus]|uniref:cleavage stimulation factor subunit 2-like n=1 Tax=Mytilus californianus TaxID=6549 RepID=UPI00224729BC|nr:cleavage stimulation factor subunit 2-like [Mytilus californianus]
MAAPMQQNTQLMPPPLTAQERANRSVFVGNIPYEATEEKLKEIFAQAGPVVSFRLVYDRETGKPKGYGFCEYQDIETAQSSMRNLNNYDFNGRPLRVGVAAGEQNRDEMKGMQHAIGGPIMESPYGEPVEAEKAPEAISKAVASLPPEQMFELMKQMKMCIQNNPTEARNMLLQNPQLAYALLQAQIVMKIVDPQVAMAMLHRDQNQIPPASSAASSASTALAAQPGTMSTAAGVAGMMNQMGQLAGIRPQTSIPQSMAAAMSMPLPMQPVMGGLGSRMGIPGLPGLPGMPGIPGLQPTPDLGGPMRAMMGGPMGNMPRPLRPEGPGADMRDPRMMPQAPRGMMPQRPVAPSAGALSSLLGSGGLQLPSNFGSGGQISAQDQEKAALIMQVLQLTDQQIAMLPSDQQQSIRILKEQISKS